MHHPPAATTRAPRLLLAVRCGVWATGLLAGAGLCFGAAPAVTPEYPPIIEPSDPWFTIDDVFWVTLLAIFLISVINAIIRRRKRDRCLKLFDHDPVTFLSPNLPTIIGLVRLESLGLELRYPRPERGPRGLPRAGTLLYDDELQAATGLCRTAASLTAEQQERRRRQLERSVRPNFWHRSLRSIRNFMNAVSDGFSKALSLTLGRMRTTGAVGTAITSQRAQTEALGQTLVSLSANAYEPLLERHIGHPVILEVKANTPQGLTVSEIPGYLVDYTAHYVAVFNLDQDPLDCYRLTVSEDSTETRGVVITMFPDAVELRSRAADPLVIRPLSEPSGSADQEEAPRRGEAVDGARLDEVVLLPGTAVRLRLPSELAERRPFQVEVTRTRQVDLICPRAVAKVRYSASEFDRDAVLRAAGVNATGTA